MIKAFDVDSRSAIKNTIAVRNLEMDFENRFSFLPHGGSFSSVGRRDMIKLTWKMKSTHTKGLVIGWVNCFRVLAL